MIKSLLLFPISNRQRRHPWGAGSFRTPPLYLNPGMADVFFELLAFGHEHVRSKEGLL